MPKKLALVTGMLSLAMSVSIVLFGGGIYACFSPLFSVVIVLTAWQFIDPGSKYEKPAQEKEKTWPITQQSNVQTAEPQTQLEAPTTTEPFAVNAEQSYRGRASFPEFLTRKPNSHLMT